MINSVSFDLKGDYNNLSLTREEGSRFVQMTYHYHSGCAYARFEFEDLKKAVEILEQVERKQL